MILTKRVQFLLCVLLLLLSVLAGMYLGYPAYQQAQANAEEIKTAQGDLKVLQDKMAQIETEKKKQQSLEGQIESIRNAVPKEPGIDLVMIDLEKMCARADVHLVGVETPDASKLQTLNASEQEMKNLAKNPLAKTSIGSKSLKQNVGDNDESNQVAKPATANAPGTTAQTKLLEQNIKQIYISGSFKGMEELLSELESYERVVEISQLAIGTPGKDNPAVRNPATDKAKKLELDQPLMTFLLKVYYLP